METLTNEVSLKEPELRAALASEPDPDETSVEGDAEARELAALTERASVGDILSATVREAADQRRSGRATNALRHRLASDSA